MKSRVFYIPNCYTYIKLETMQENYLAKWLNNELSEEELARFKESKEYASYLKLRKATDKLVGPDFDMEKAWEDLNKQKTSIES